MIIVTDDKAPFTRKGIAELISHNSIRHVVAVAPHSDDLAFSIPCTLRWIYNAGLHITILTCFSRSLNTTIPIAADINVISNLRKTEDELFVAHLGCQAELIWLDYDDAPIRGYLGSNLFLRHSGENVLAARLASKTLLSANDQALAKAVEHKLLAWDSSQTCFFIPLSMGNHVDHVITSVAGRALIANGSSPVVFYEDLPYAAFYGAARVQNTVIGFNDTPCQCVICYEMFSADFLQYKASAAQCYSSQISPKTARLIAYYCQNLAEKHGVVERLWRYQLA